ncbi:EAL domain-containing protein [Williamsia sp. CHRR-6]|uniref:EAL domain-containing protein n=1 Tax=Williamsia sp. CHRR-6 TaxID=2835871 RepID=UPI001BDACB85|nr:EAL domain-containing protein [Williamsia sp. CHRR-6]MBT0567659.1 EAL domain-containing protein [Williamsia sp. CHRR-6]
MIPSSSDVLDELLGAHRKVRSVFQPIVDIGSSTVVGFEALARFPNRPGVGPYEMFTRARELGVLGALDWECRRAAMLGAQQGGMTGPLRLFLNIEPGVVGEPPPWEIDPMALRDAAAATSLVLELTERALLSNPRSVLWVADWAHEQGCSIALDDVGVNADSITLLPLLRPDIIKLDRSMLAAELGREQERTLRVAREYIAETGALLLCEGVETERDLHRAVELGAVLGQGYHFGRPGPLAITDDLMAAARCSDVLDQDATVVPVRSTDIQQLLDGQPTRVDPLGEIEEIRLAMEERVLAGNGDTCVLLSLPDPALFDTATAVRYQKLSDSCSLVGVIGAGTRLPHGVRGARMQALDDHIVLVRLGADDGATLVARDLGDTGPLMARRYAWNHTTDRAAVTAMARVLARRLSLEHEDRVGVRARRAHGAPHSVYENLCAIAETVVAVVPGLESVGLSLVSADGKVRTVGASNQFPMLLDHIAQHYGVSSGFGLDQGAPVLHIADLDADERWESYRRMVTALGPVGSVVQYHLAAHQGRSALLTMYSHRPHNFGPGILAQAHAMARWTQSRWLRVHPSIGQLGAQLTVLPLSDRGDVAQRADTLLDRVLAPVTPGFED